MEIIERNIAELIHAEYNPRQLTKDQHKALTDSLTRFGMVDPVIVNKHAERLDIIVGGHQRTKVWGEMGNTTIPTVEVDLTPDKEKELNVRLNKNSGQFDFDMLANHFDAEDLIEWGFDETELDFFEAPEAEEDDFSIPDEIHTDVVLGDLIEIGEHRLLCGDSTNSDDVERLMDGEKADMVFTDPPYGMNLDTDYSSIKGTSKMAKTLTAKKHDKVIGDDVDFDPTFILELFNKTKEIFLWGADYYCQLLPKNGSWTVWDKTGGNDSLMDAGFASNFELCWSKQKHKRDIARFTWKGVCGRGGEKTVHPTQKPVKMAIWFIDRWGKDGDLVIDLFLGSGTTMVATHQLNRKCYGMELDPKYCQVIIDRMHKLDTTLMIKINGEMYDKRELETA